MLSKQCKGGKSKPRGGDYNKQDEYNKCGGYNNQGDYDNRRGYNNRDDYNNWGGDITEACIIIPGRKKQFSYKI